MQCLIRFIDLLYVGCIAQTNKRHSLCWLCRADVTTKPKLQSSFTIIIIISTTITIIITSIIIIIIIILSVARTRIWDSRRCGKHIFYIGFLGLLWIRHSTSTQTLLLQLLSSRCNYYARVISSVNFILTTRYFGLKVVRTAHHSRGSLPLLPGG